MQTKWGREGGGDGDDDALTTKQPELSELVCSEIGYKSE